MMMLDLLPPPNTEVEDRRPVPAIVERFLNRQGSG
jgi:hypothetical protein